MPYSIRKNPNQDTFKVVNKDTKRVYAYRTKDPVKLIQAIEINKRKSKVAAKKSKKSRRGTRRGTRRGARRGTRRG